MRVTVACKNIDDDQIGKNKFAATSAAAKSGQSAARSGYSWAQTGDGCVIQGARWQNEDRQASRKMSGTWAFMGISAESGVIRVAKSLSNSLEMICIILSVLAVLMCGKPGNRFNRYKLHN